MNKTLLLVICDFLLLNILALTRWENAEPVRPQQTPAASSGADPATQDQDIVDVMKMSLEDERAQREQLAKQLQSTEESLQSREQSLARLESERTQLASGILRTIDNQIDLATGTLKLKAEFPNADEKLFPNQFVNVRLQVATLKDALVIPAAAVQFGSKGTYVYVVNAKSESTIRPVELGPSDGVLQAVNQGLEAGDRVVLEGLDHLREGKKVVVVQGKEAVATSP